MTPLIIFYEIGSGMEELGKKLSKALNIPVFSIVESVGNETRSKSNIGKAINSELNKGKFIPTELINQTIEKTAPNEGFKGLITIGYPRTKKHFDELLKIYDQKFEQKVFVNLIQPSPKVGTEDARIRIEKWRKSKKDFLLQIEDDVEFLEIRVPNSRFSSEEQFNELTKKLKNKLSSPL